MVRRARRRWYPRFRRSRRRGSTTIPIAAVGGAVAGLFTRPPGEGNSAFEFAMAGNWQWAMNEAIYSYTGFHPVSGKWDITKAVGLQAAIIGALVHWVAGKFGVNRALGRAKVPMLRI